MAADKTTQRRIGAVPPDSLPPVSLAVVTDTEIARRAYDLYQSRGEAHGHDVDDWLQAERELTSTRQPGAPRRGEEVAKRAATVRRAARRTVAVRGGAERPKP